MDPDLLCSDTFFRRGVIDIDLQPTTSDSEELLSVEFDETATKELADGYTVMTAPGRPPFC